VQGTCFEHFCCSSVESTFSCESGRASPCLMGLVPKSVAFPVGCKVPLVSRARGVHRLVATVARSRTKQCHIFNSLTKAVG